MPNAWQSLVELIHDFILNTVNEQIGGYRVNVKHKLIYQICDWKRNMGCAP